MIRWWKHKTRQSIYLEFATGELQCSRPELLKDGAPMLIYIGMDGKVWVRAEAEFKDGRYEPTSTPPA